MKKKDKSVDANKQEIPTKRIAGLFLALTPILFWIFLYLRFDCQPRGCSIKMDWLLIGFASIIMGLALLVSNPKPRDDSDDEEENADEER